MTPTAWVERLNLCIDTFTKDFSSIRHENTYDWPDLELFVAGKNLIFSFFNYMQSHYILYDVHGRHY